MTGDLRPTMFARVLGAAKCAHCGKQATCIGAYENAQTEDFACDECCGHGCEDGHCERLPGPMTDAKPMDDVESDEPTALDVLLGIVSGLMLSFSVAEIRIAVDHISELGEEHWEAFEKYEETVVAPQWDHVERRLKRTPPKREH